MIETAAPIIFWGGIAAMVIMALVGKVHVSLMLLVPLLPLQNILYRFHSYPPFGKDFVDIILTAMVLGWVLASIVRGERLLERSPFNTILVAMVIYSAFSLFRGFSYLNPGFEDTRLHDWKNYMVLPLLYFLAVNNVKSVGQMKWLLFFMFLSLFLVDLYTVRQIGNMTSVESRSRLPGTFVYLGPNQVAAFYVQTVLLLGGIFLMYRAKFMRLMYATLIAIGVFVILFLYSRGAYIALVTGILTISLLARKRWIVPLVVLFVVWQVVLPRAVVSRIAETRGADGGFDNSSAQRLELWKESLRLFAEKPVTGVGFGVISSRGLQFGFRDTHNIYLKILAEQGLIGITIFLLLLFLALRSGLRLYREADDAFLKGLGLGFSAAVVGVMTANIFGDRWTFVQVGAYFWVSMALVARGNIITENSRAEERGEESLVPA